MRGLLVREPVLHGDRHINALVNTRSVRKKGVCFAQKIGNLNFESVCPILKRKLWVKP